MDKNYTHIVVVLDRSGSMQSCASDMEGGLRALIEKQAKEPGKCTVSLYRFNDSTDKVLNFADIKSIESDNLRLEPRGGTALYDALGIAIDETGRELAKLPESLRPGFISFVIITDGGENASREFNAGQIKEKTSHQQSVYSWDFVYLGANQDAFNVGNTVGVGKAYNFTTQNSDKVWDSYNAKMCLARGASAMGLVPDISYTTEEERELNQ